LSEVKTVSLSDDCAEGIDVGVGTADVNAVGVVVVGIAGDVFS
jgi:hypothetical protein